MENVTEGTIGLSQRTEKFSLGPEDKISLGERDPLDVRNSSTGESKLEGTKDVKFKALLHRNVKFKPNEESKQEGTEAAEGSRLKTIETARLPPPHMMSKGQTGSSLQECPQFRHRRRDLSSQTISIRLQGRKDLPLSIVPSEKP